MESSMTGGPEAREALGQLGKYWWLWIVFGIGWTVIALVILQFDSASIGTVGIIIGLMFIAAGMQNFVLAAVADQLRWLWGIFGVLFLIAGVIALIKPGQTFAAFADVLGFLFLIVGIFWTIEAFATKEENPAWWLGLTAGILMIVMAFWTSGQLLIEKAYVLLVFAGAWALMHGIVDIVRAFQLRKLKDMAP